MLLAHGTTEKMADLIEAVGHFDKHTYFLKTSPDYKHAIFGTAGFALRDNPLTEKYVDLYCKHDILFVPFKNGLKKIGEQYVKDKVGDDSLGLIYVVDASSDILDYHKGLFRSIFLPTEVFSTERIPTSSIDHVVTLGQNVGYFEKKYGHKTLALEDIAEDPLYKRLYHSLSSRSQRLILGRK